MQTPAERALIDRAAAYLRQHEGDDAPVLNIGAGSSSVIEAGVASRSGGFVCDRLDVADCRVSHPSVRDCHIASVESMPLPDGAYRLAFANYVLEHVEDLPAATREIARVLQPGGQFIVSAPNPRAPEFMLARFTPLWFHRYVREANDPGHGAHETHYAYRSIDHLAGMFAQAGLDLVEAQYFANTYAYLNRVPLAGALSRLYDAAVTRLNLTSLMGNVCLTLQKPVERSAAGHREEPAGATANAGSPS